MSDLPPVNHHRAQLSAPTPDAHAAAHQISNASSSPWPPGGPALQGAGIPQLIESKAQAQAEAHDAKSVVQRWSSAGGAAAHQDVAASIDAALARIFQRQGAYGTNWMRIARNVCQAIHNSRIGRVSFKEEQLLSALIGTLPRFSGEQILGAVRGILEMAGDSLDPKQRLDLLNRLIRGLPVSQMGAVGAAIGSYQSANRGPFLQSLAPLFERLELPALTAFTCGLAVHIEPTDRERVFSPHIDTPPTVSQASGTTTRDCARSGSIRAGVQLAGNPLSEFLDADGLAITPGAPGRLERLKAVMPIPGLLSEVQVTNLITHVPAEDIPWAEVYTCVGSWGAGRAQALSTQQLPLAREAFKGKVKEILSPQNLADFSNVFEPIRTYLARVGLRAPRERRAQSGVEFDAHARAVHLQALRDLRSWVEEQKAPPAAEELSEQAREDRLSILFVLSTELRDLIDTLGPGPTATPTAGLAQPVSSASARPVSSSSLSSSSSILTQRPGREPGYDGKGGSMDVDE